MNGRMGNRSCDEKGKVAEAGCGIPLMARHARERVRSQPLRSARDSASGLPAPLGAGRRGDRETVVHVQQRNAVIAGRRTDGLRRLLLRELAQRVGHIDDADDDQITAMSMMEATPGEPLSTIAVTDRATSTDPRASARDCRPGWSARSARIMRRLSRSMRLTRRR